MIIMLWDAYRFADIDNSNNSFGVNISRISLAIAHLNYANIYHTSISTPLKKLPKPLKDLLFLRSNWGWENLKPELISSLLELLFSITLSLQHFGALFYTIDHLKTFPLLLSRKLPQVFQTQLCPLVSLNTAGYENINFLLSNRLKIKLLY